MPEASRNSLLIESTYSSLENVYWFSVDFGCVKTPINTGLSCSSMSCESRRVFLWRNFSFALAKVDSTARETMAEISDSFRMF